MQENAPLRRHSHYAIGGAARYFCSASSLHELVRAVSFARESGLPLFVLGGGTNVLFGDEGFTGVVVRPAIDFIAAVEAPDGRALVTAGAGASMERLLDFCVERGYGGLEWAGGLPGTVGGAVRGNAGAFGGEIKDVLHEVASIESANPRRIVKRARAECAFGYRTSVFRACAGAEIILAASFMLAPQDPAALRRVIEEKKAWRASRQPLDYPNAGSIFKNVPFASAPPALQADPAFARHVKHDPFPVIPAAYLIDQAGLKGVSCGGAMISQKHPNFIVNAAGAEAAHIKSLIALVKAAVREKFGIELQEEIEYV
jgi:UDP-N-acetylmuramate dehydrogenase